MSVCTCEFLSAVIPPPPRKSHILPYLHRGAGNLTVSMFQVSQTIIGHPTPMLTTRETLNQSTESRRLASSMPLCVIYATRPPPLRLPCAQSHCCPRCFCPHPTHLDSPQLVEIGLSASKLAWTRRSQPGRVKAGLNASEPSSKFNPGTSQLCSGLPPPPSPS